MTDPVDGAAEAIIKQAPNANNKRNNKKRGGAVDLLLPFTQSGTIDEQDGTAANAVITRPSGRKRQQQPGPKHNPKPGPSFVPTSHDHSSSSSVRYL